MQSRQVDPDHLPAGTYLNTGAAASRALRFNRFCYDLRHKENRDRFQAPRYHGSGRCGGRKAVSCG